MNPLFQKRGLDIIDVITPKYILTSIDYFTRWMEPIRLRKVNENELEYALEKGIKVKYSTKYYLHGNGVVESYNKNIIRILQKIVIKNQRNWHNVLSNALWEDWDTPKVGMGNSPYLYMGRKIFLFPTYTFHLFNYLN